jgi:hypothetical protein
MLKIDLPTSALFTLPDSRHLREGRVNENSRRKLTIRMVITKHMTSCHVPFPLGIRLGQHANVEALIANVEALIANAYIPGVCGA